MNKTDISVVIPIFNEAQSLSELHTWTARVMQQHGYSYEVIFVDDGSNDGSWDVINRLAGADPNVKAIRFRRNYGKSAALNTAFQSSIGRVVITMDADLQDSPDEIPELFRMIINEGFDLVSGWKKKRHDPPTKTLPTRLFNWATRKMSGIQLHDFNCGLKAYKSEVVKSIEVYGEMHRYIPVIAKWAGFVNIGEKVVQHYPRKYGTTKFGMERFINGFLDLLTIIFISRYLKKPMHFFGTLGAASTFIGIVISIYLSYLKIFQNVPLSNRPLLLLAVLLILLGVQFFIIGLVGEMILRNSTERNNYLVAKRIGASEINEK